MIKYLYREHKGYAFRVCLEDGRDSILGSYVTIEIQEAKPAPRNRLDAFIQCWTVKSYTHGTWYSFKKYPLEQTIKNLLDYVVSTFDDEIRFVKEWGEI